MCIAAGAGRGPAHDRDGAPWAGAAPSRAVRGVGALLVLATTAVTLSGCVVLDACPAIAYLYSGPAVLRFTESLPGSASVAACFGSDCTPSEVPRDDGVRWEVPQEPPFVEEGVIADGYIRDVRVVVTGSDGARSSDVVHPIPVRVERTGVFGQCGGPFEFEEVPIAVQP